MDPNAWPALVHAKAKKLCPSRVREEVEAEALGALWLHWHEGKRIDALSGLATMIVRTCLSRVRRRQGKLAYVESDTLDDLPCASSVEWSPTDVEAAAALAEVVPRLRGPRQRWLCEHAILGFTSIMMAEMLGQSTKEIRRQLNDVSQKCAS